MIRVRLITFTLLMMLSTVSSSEGGLILALDYDFDQDCENAQVCFGWIDFIESFEYDLADGVVRITTNRPTDCSQDGIFRDRFQFNVKIELNGVMVGTLKRLQYVISDGIIWVDTHELNFNCGT